MLQDHAEAKPKSAKRETVTRDQQEEVNQGNFKMALETIAFIMNGSIEVGTALNLESEATTSFNSETSTDLNTHVSSEVDSDSVSNSYSESTNRDLDSEKNEDLKSQTSNEY